MSACSTAAAAGGPDGLLAKLCARHDRYAGEAMGRLCRLWDAGFEASAVRVRRHLYACMRYIELNPQRIGWHIQAGDYRWSSAAHHLGLAVDLYPTGAVLAACIIATFGLLAMHAYVSYARAPSAGRYLLIAAAFARPRVITGMAIWRSCSRKGAARKTKTIGTLQGPRSPTSPPLM